MEHPPDWLYKPDPSRNYTHMFVDEAGNKLDSKSKAIQHLQKAGKLSMEIRKVFEQIGQSAKKKRISEGRANLMSDPSWEPDVTLPENWKSRPSKTVPTSRCVLSPEGMFFESKIKAYKYLCEQKDSEEVKNVRMEMKSMLIKHNGYQESPLLPKDWLFKHDKILNSCSYLTETGYRLQSTSSACTIMSKQYEHNPEIVDNFKTFLSQFSISIKPEDPLQWNENDATIPKGWLSRSFPQKQTIVLKHPSGMTFGNRRQALKHLIDSHEEESRIQEMRGCMKYEDWMEHELLPANWYFKKYTENLIFLTDLAEVYHGHEKALQVLKRDSRYSSEDLDNLKLFLEQVLSTIIQKVKVIKKEEAVETKNINQNGKMLFEDIQNLLKSDSEESKGEGRRHLVSRGWEENMFLPNNWMCKKSVNSSLTPNIISANGEIFNSFRPLIQHLKDNPEYNQEDINKLSKFPDGKTRKKVEYWISAIAPVPKSAPTEKKYTVKQYMNALKTPDSTSNSDILEMRSYLLRTGWREDEALVPRGWLFKQRPGLPTIMFLTEAGDLLANVKEANIFLADRGFTIDGKKCQERFDDNYELDLRRMERSANIKEEKMTLPSNFPSNITVTMVNQPKPEVKAEKQAKKFSLDVLDMERNQPIAGFKNIFHKLEIFKKSVVNGTSRGSKNNPDLNLDLL